MLHTLAKPAQLRQITAGPLDKYGRPTEVEVIVEVTAAVLPRTSEETATGVHARATGLILETLDDQPPTASDALIYSGVVYAITNRPVWVEHPQVPGVAKCWRFTCQAAS